MKEDLLKKIRKNEVYRKIEELKAYSIKHFKENLENVLYQKVYREGGSLIFVEKDKDSLKKVLKNLYDTTNYFANQIVDGEEYYVVILPGLKDKKTLESLKEKYKNISHYYVFQERQIKKEDFDVIF